jgi:hypothetical protein
MNGRIAVTNGAEVALEVSEIHRIEPYLTLAVKAQNRINYGSHAR